MGLIAIGDIHGCARTLDHLLEVLTPADSDHLVFVGDYVDRGPDSRGVIQRLLALRERYTCTFLRGNHEAMMLGYLDRGDFDLWRLNGGLETLYSYGGAGRPIDIPEAHVAFLHATELYLETADYFFVHAGLKPQYTIRENLLSFGEDVFLWERSHLAAERVAWEKPVVCGHTPRPEPIDRPHLVGIDTGCVYHRHADLGRLTAVRLPERAFFDVPYAG